MNNHVEQLRQELVNAENEVRRMQGIVHAAALRHSTAALRLQHSEGAWQEAMRAGNGADAQEQDVYDAEDGLRLATDALVIAVACLHDARTLGKCCHDAIQAAVVFAVRRAS